MFFRFYSSYLYYVFSRFCSLRTLFPSVLLIFWIVLLSNILAFFIFFELLDSSGFSTCCPCGLTNLLQLNLKFSFFFVLCFFYLDHTGRLGDSMANAK
jgi:hypothetical protein